MRGLPRHSIYLPPPPQEMVARLPPKLLPPTEGLHPQRHTPAYTPTIFSFAAVTCV